MDEQEKRYLKKIKSPKEIEGINGRNLQQIIGNESDFDEWISFWANSFKGEDEYVVIIDTGSGKPEYVLSLDMAIHIAEKQNNTHGNEIAEYIASQK